MTETVNNKDRMEEQLVIDKQYKLQERSKAIEIIRKAMDLAREEIPKGKELIADLRFTGIDP